MITLTNTIVVTDEEKTVLMNNAVKLANEMDGIQVVVSTVNSLEGDTVENYALNMYNKYGIGKNDMGLLILLSTGDRKIRVEVGRAMEGYINDSKAGRFMDKYAIPYLKDNKFIHSTTKRGVIISSLYEEYYVKHYVASGRVIIY